MQQNNVLLSSNLRRVMFRNNMLWNIEDKLKLKIVKLDSVRKNHFFFIFSLKLNNKTIFDKLNSDNINLIFIKFKTTTCKQFFFFSLFLRMAYNIWLRFSFFFSFFFSSCPVLGCVVLISCVFDIFFELTNNYRWSQVFNCASWQG